MHQPVWGVALAAAEGAFCAAFWKHRVRLQILNKNHAGWKGTGGIHPAILMNCAAQAALKSASEADFSLPIRCGFYQTRLRALYASEKGHGSFPACGRSPLPDRLVASGRWIFLLSGQEAAREAD